MNKIKIMLLTMICLIISANLYSTRLENVPIELKQPDGTIINAFVTGFSTVDGYSDGRIHNSEKFTMIQDDVSGKWCWAKQASDGSLESTGYEVYIYDPKTLGIKPGEDISDEFRNQRLIEWRKRIEEKDSDKVRSGQSRFAPSQAIIEQIVIFIRFSGDPEFTTPTGYFEDIFNGFTSGKNSLKRYYYDTSYGKLIINSHFYPISNTSAVISYQSPRDRNYFLPYDPNLNPDGYFDGSNIAVADSLTRRYREFNLIKDACDFVSSQIPPSLNIDADNNGYIDNINFIIRGTLDPKYGIL